MRGHFIFYARVGLSIAIIYVHGLHEYEYEFQHIANFAASRNYCKS